MITKMFSVYDSKVCVFTSPFFARGIGEALRMFIDIANDKQTTIARHPEDYSLVLIGDFDDETGLANPCNHQNLGVAASFVQPKAVEELPAPWKVPAEVISANGKEDK